LGLWEKEWVKILPDLRAARQLLEKKAVQNGEAKLFRQFSRLLDFMEKNYDRIKPTAARIRALAGTARQDHRQACTMVDNLLADLKNSLMLPLSSLLAIFPKMVRDLSRSLGKEAKAFQADVARVAQVKKVFAGVREEFGRVDILVNNAGVTLGKPALEVTEEEWDRVIDINLKGAFFAAQAAGREMMAQGGGNIVNISSVGALVAEKNTAVYSLSKAGLITLTRNLAREWAGYNIRVNAVAPGYARTPLTEFIMKDEKTYNAILKRVPLRRLCTAEDVARAVLFLVSEASSFITGHVLVVDGGQSTG
ncbi:MAG: SDR family oxidoreductase, partial [Peptococcaceae bacterium]|nr:SDR family oxidoreductase [Peptococcaceae bacterium]